MNDSDKLAFAIRFLRSLRLTDAEIERITHGEAIEGDHAIPSALEFDNMTRYLQSLGISDAQVVLIKRFGPSYVDDAPTVPSPCPIPSEVD